MYIDPEDEFDSVCTGIHGISSARVNGAPNFATAWVSIEKYFTNAVIVGHNVVAADIDALIKNFRRYNIDIPELYYIDTLNVATTYINPYDVANYSLDNLCKHFKIDYTNKHNAYYDALASAELLKVLIRAYSIDANSIIRKYIPHETESFSAYLSNPALRKKITELYGVLRGFTIDNEISQGEADYLVRWKEENSKFAYQEEIRSILFAIDDILSDGIVTLQEVIDLQRMFKEYLDVVSTSPVTLATQILDGIMKGITVDGVITADECDMLRMWMYDNIYLSGHFPFNTLLDALDRVLEDGILTDDESKEIMKVIDELLNPIEATRAQIYSVDEKHVCLSGEFRYGKKSDVEALLIQKGAIIDSSVKKTTDILMVGDSECSSFSNGTYGTKVKKAMEYNSKGRNILIIKESDYFH